MRRVVDQKVVCGRESACVWKGIGGMIAPAPQGNALMSKAAILAPKRLAAAFVAVAMVFAFSASAQAVEKRVRHHLHARGGDIVVRTGRSYLDPGTTAGHWTEDQYMGETAQAVDPGLGYSFGRFGQSVLPSRFSPPGQEPLFRF